MSGPGSPKGQRMNNVGEKKTQQKSNKIQNTIDARQRRDSKGKRISNAINKSGRIVRNMTKNEKLAASRLKKAESLIPEGKINHIDIGKNRKGNFLIHRFRKGDTSHTVVENRKTGKTHEKINFDDDVVEVQRKKPRQPKAPRIKRNNSSTTQKGKYDHLPENEQRFWKYIAHVAEVSRKWHEKNDVKPGSEKTKLRNASEGIDALPSQSRIKLKNGTHRWDSAFFKDSRMYLPDSTNKSVRWIETKNIPYGATTIVNGRLSSIQDANKKGTNKNKANYWIYRSGNSIEVFPNYPEDKATVTEFIRKARKMPISDYFGKSPKPDAKAVKTLQKVNKQLNSWMNTYLEKGESLSSARQKVWKRALNELKTEILNVMNIVGIAMAANAALSLFGMRGGVRGTRFSSRTNRDISAPKNTPGKSVTTSPNKPLSKPRRLKNMRKYAPNQMEKVHDNATQDSFLPPEGAKIRTKAGSFRKSPDFIPTEHPKSRGYKRVGTAKGITREAQLKGLDLKESRIELTKGMSPPPGNQKDLWNAHHVIPYQNRNHPVIREIFPEGWNIHNGKQNGIYLPTQAGVNGAGKQMLHSTNHPRYRRIVTKKLDEIHQSSKSPAGKKKEVEKLVTELKNHLTNGSENGPRHMR